MSTKIKADIVPYASEYRAAVRSWIDSEETLVNLCQAGAFPPPDDVIDSWQREGVGAYLMFSEGKPVAYGEIWAGPIDLEVEIAHLLVEPTKRRRGTGTKMLELLYQRASQRPDVALVVLNVFSENRTALGCYLRAGFELLGASPEGDGLRLIKRV